MSLDEEYRLFIDNRGYQILRQRLGLEKLTKVVVAIGANTENEYNYNIDYLDEDSIWRTQSIDEVRQRLESLFVNSNSNNNKDLDEFLQAIGKLEQIISRKRNEIEINIVQPSVGNKRAKLIELLQREISRLEEFKTYLESIKKALAYLNPTTREEALHNLLEKSVEPALVNYPELINLRTLEGLHNYGLFYGDIKDFLYLIRGCLLMGKPDLLNYAFREKKLPRSPLSLASYAEAFNYIKNQVGLEQSIAGKPAAELNNT